MITYLVAFVAVLVATLSVWAVLTTAQWGKANKQKDEERTSRMWRVKESTSNVYSRVTGGDQPVNLKTDSFIIPEEFKTLAKPSKT